MRRMKNKIFASVLLTVLFLGLFPLTASAATPGAIVIGNNYTLDSGQILNDNLIIIGGNVDLKNGSRINGNVILVGGVAEAAGTISGNVWVFGGTMNLASTFVLNGDLTTGSTAINRDPGAKINGQININEIGPTYVIPGQIQVPNLTTNLNPALKVAGFFLRLILWALAAMVLAMFIPNPLNRTSHAAVTQPLISGGMGLLTIIVVPILAVLLAITICLIPVSVVGILLLVIAWLYGLIALGYEVGKRITSGSTVTWHPALSAGLGTLLLMGVLNGVEAVIPCVGWIPKFLIGLVGLGAVLLTQFGMKDYLPTSNTPTTSSVDVLPPPT